MRILKTKKRKSGFTLIELLLSIAIVAILSTTVVVVARPTTRLGQSRDLQRVLDLGALDTALRLATFNAEFMGTSTIIYLSLPDNSSSTCGSYALTPPIGYTYQCASTANNEKADGTGWIPINFSGISELSFNALPLDPATSASSSLYYSYIPGGDSFELNALLEFGATSPIGVPDPATIDGGDSTQLYEKGTNLRLSPITSRP